MKRYGNLWEKICTFDNIYKAHMNARRGKEWYKEVQYVDEYTYECIFKILDSFEDHTYKTSEYVPYLKTDGVKPRMIYKLPYFPDRIAQWAVLQVIEPYVMKSFITDTFSAIPGRGIHTGFKRVKNAIQNDYENCTYCLKLDVRHFYQSINHDILKQKFRKLFKDKDLLWILDEIIDSINTANEEDMKAIYGDEVIDSDEYVFDAPELLTGIPIGNYLSQYCGNFYLSDFDHWIKEQKHIKYYFRYMDDMVIFGSNKNDLRALLEEIKVYLRDNLKIVLKGNYQIFPSNVRGVDFLGYRFFKDYVLLRKRTCVEMKKKMSQLLKKVKTGKLMNYSEWCSVNSYYGWIKHCNHFNLENKYIRPLLPYCKLYYETVIKKPKQRKNTSEFISSLDYDKYDDE